MVGGVVGAPEVQLSRDAVVPAVEMPRCRSVACKLVDEGKKSVGRMTLGTRVVGSAVLAARSAVRVEQEVVEDLAGHLLKKQTILPTPPS